MIGKKKSKSQKSPGYCLSEDGDHPGSQFSGSAGDQEPLIPQDFAHQFQNSLNVNNLRM